MSASKVSVARSEVLRPLPDFASVLPIVRSHRTAGTAAVVVAIVRNESPLPVRPSERLVVSHDGTVSGSFPAFVLERLRTDALAALSSRRSRLTSYRVEESTLQEVETQGGNVDVYFEVLDSTPRLIVVGGGHIALPLTRIAKIAGYEIHVLDDRAEYASAERFPDVDSVSYGPYETTLATLPIDDHTYIVLVTRGHVHDAACLRYAIGTPAPYIGMIGSKKRVKTVLQQLDLSVESRESVARVYAPIGLDIGSTSPEEIAIAIVAEIINVRRGGKAASLSLQHRART